MKKLILLLALAFTGNACCQSAGDILQTKLNAISSMTANFNQVVNAKEKEISRSSGTMALERPGRFRWQTKNPMEQLVVADGKKLWVYDVDLEQVTVRKQKKGLGGTAALFLSGYNHSVTRDFDVAVATTGTNQSYDLHSKSPKANFQRITLIFKHDVLIGIEMFDQLGQHTVVNFKNVKTNLKIAASLFQFKPPKGTDIVQQ
jgi:outer membrane lipoprotein carrier protein